MDYKGHPCVLYGLWRSSWVLNVLLGKPVRAVWAACDNTYEHEL